MRAYNTPIINGNEVIHTLIHLGQFVGEGFSYGVENGSKKKYKRNQ